MQSSRLGEVEGGLGGEHAGAFFAGLDFDHDVEGRGLVLEDQGEGVDLLAVVDADSDADVAVEA